jgi:hypothetical protein
VKLIRETRRDRIGRLIIRFTAAVRVVFQAAKSTPAGCVGFRAAGGVNRAGGFPEPC